MSTTSSHASTAGAIMIATSWPSAAPVIIGIPRRQYGSAQNSAPHSGEQRNGVTTQEGKIDMMEKDKPNEYPIVVESGLLSGSVRVIGTLPDTMSSAQSARLESAIRTVRESGTEGLQTTITFVIKNGTWNV